MPFLPLHDHNPRVYIRQHYVTIGLIVVNVAIHLLRLGEADADSFLTALGFGFVPVRLFEGAELAPGIPATPPLLSLLTYQFLHGGWLHLGFNMLFLWVFGDNVEDAMGHGRFFFFYLACGMIAGLVHGLTDVNSPVPTLGASSAISGVLGAYAVLYPRARLLVLAFGIVPWSLPALLVIGAWFAQDLLWGATGSPAADGVAVWAHIGGMVAGAALTPLARNDRRPPLGRIARPWQ
jgi:membrane associated rhomboid family serine protease